MDKSIAVEMVRKVMAEDYDLPSPHALDLVSSGGESLTLAAAFDDDSVPYADINQEYDVMTEEEADALAADTLEQNLEFLVDPGTFAHITGTVEKKIRRLMDRTPDFELGDNLLRIIEGAAKKARGVDADTAMRQFYNHFTVYYDRGYILGAYDHWEHVEFGDDGQEYCIYRVQ